MTAQLRDTLEHAGNTMGMTSLPLSTYWLMNDSRQADDATNARHFADMGTFCWRRYTAQWRIEQEHLYLVAINATYEDGTQAELEDFFPGYPERVFAHWFSGELRCPRGELLEYVHAGFASRYAETLVFTIERGVVKGQRCIDNRIQGANT